MRTKLFIKSIDDDTAVVAGYGVVYGGRDLEGETFEKDTDLMLDLVPEKPLMYDHGLDVKNFLGKVLSTEPDDIGVWVESEIDRHKEYAGEVLRLVEKGVLGYSSGSVGHLVERLGNVIKRWPVVEFSLTPTPAEPRTLSVDRIKAIAAEYPQFTELLPEAEAEARKGAEAVDQDDETDDADKQIQDQEERKWTKKRITVILR